ncbi:MAG: ATP synthase subunit I [Candidatus Nitrospinota bacterium M3_3B_026]
MPRDVTGLRRLLVLLCLALSLTSLAFGRFDAAFSTTFGCLFSLVNFVFLEKLLGFTLEHVPAPAAARAMTVVSFYLRFAVFAAALYVFNAMGWINFIALAIGLSTTAAAIFGWFAAKGLGAGGEEYERAC